MPLLLSLTRHGETADNARRIFQGQGGASLNRLGRAQAECLAERVRRSPPDAIVASDLARASETAHIVSEACGVPVEIEAGLREVDVGAWNGKSYDEVATLFPDEWNAWENGVDVRRGGGETYAELAARVDETIGRVAERHRSRDVTRLLLVSHGGSIKSWVARILGVTAKGLWALGGVANAGISVVERDAKGRHRLHSWNDVAHLQGLVAAEHAD